VSGRVKGGSSGWTAASAGWRLWAAVLVAAVGAVLCLGSGWVRADAPPPPGGDSALLCNGEGPSDSVAPSISPTGNGPATRTLTLNEGTWVLTTGECGTRISSYQYAWLRNGTPISGQSGGGSTETSPTYTTVGADLNQTITAQVTVCDNLNYCTGPIVATGSYVPRQAPANTVAPSISVNGGGAVQVGKTLTAANGTWTGFTPITYTYQWKWSATSNGTYNNVASGGTSQTYTVPSTYYNDYLKVVVTGTNVAGSASATSAATAQVGGQAPTAGTVAISGTSQSGQTLTATASGFTVGTPTGQYVYTWYRCVNASDTPGQGTCTTVDRTSSATSSATDNYTAIGADVNDYLKVVVTASNSCPSGCGSVSATSAASSQVKGVAPTAGTAAISGTAQVGQPLTAVPSGFNLGTPTATYTYQWTYSTTSGGTYSNVQSGGTSANYTVDPTYYNDYLKVVITATNTCSSGCGSASATSAASSQVLPAGPSGGSVSVSGLALVGSTLTATACSSQGWSPSTPAASCAFQWQVSSASSGPWSNAAGAGNTTASYTIASADANQYLRVTVSATNPGGSGTAASAATSQVQNTVTGTIPWGGTQSQDMTIQSSAYSVAASFTTTTANTQIYLDWGGSGFYCHNNIKLYDPNSFLIWSGEWCSADISRLVLATVGTYTIVVIPGGGTNYPATVHFQLWADPPDVNGGTLPADGLPHSFNIPTPGQWGYFTFQGTAGQTFWVDAAGGEYTGVGQSVYLYTPDGNLWQTTSGGGGFDTQLLPQTGTYKLEYRPNQCPCAGDLTGNKSFALNLPVPIDDHGFMPMNSTSSFSIASNEGGKRAWRVFMGQAGEPVTVTWGGDFYTVGDAQIFQLNMQGQIVSTLYGPGGHGGGSTTLNLPATAPYLVYVDPQQTPFQIGAGTASITISSPWVVPQQQEKGCDAAGNGTNNAAFTGDVNTLAGTYSTSVNDIGLPGLGIPLNFSRCYSSAYYNVQGALGYGWNNSFGAKLAIDGSGNVTLTDENLQQIGYTKQADGSYLSTFSNSTLTKLGDGSYRIVKHGGDTYHFDANGNLLSVKDRNGEGLTYAYNGSNQLTTVTDQEGRTATVGWNGSGFIQSVSFSDGRSVNFGYTNGYLTSYTDVRGKTWTYAYDANGRLASIQDPLTHYPIRNTYTNGQVTSQQDANGNTRSFTYGSNLAVSGTSTNNTTPISGTVSNAQTTTMTDAAGKTWIDTYADNELVSRTDPLGNTTNYTYDSKGNKLTSTDPKGHVTTMTYDGNGNMLTLAPPPALGYQSQVWTYNSMNEVLTHQDSRGNTTTYNYDANGNLTSIVKPGSLTTTFNLHPGNAELVDSTVDARNQTTSYAYNSLNQLTSATDPDGNKTTYGYDAAGRRTTVTTPRGNVTGNNPADFTTTTVYDAAGNKLSVTTPPSALGGAGNQTTYVYDDAGRLQSMVDPLGNVSGCGCAAQHTTAYGYNNGNQLTSVTRPGSPATSIQYNSRDLVQSRTDALGDTTSYTYNDAGWLKTVLSPNGNVAGCNSTCQAGYTTTYTYDGDGNRASVVNPLGGETDYTYDALDRRTQTVVHGAQAGTETTNYSYDANGNLTEIADPLRTTDKTYTANNQLLTSTIGGLTTTYAYNNDGKLNSVTGPAPRSGVTTYNYDNADLLTSTVSPLGNVTGCGCAAQYTTTYGYDQDGNLHTVTDPLNHTTTTNYNGAKQPLNTFDPSNRETQWQYDADGNLLVTTANDLSTTTYTYDALGHLLTRKDGNNHTTTYTPNVLGQLTQVVDPIGDTTTYLYDANGNRYQTEDAIANHANNPSLGTTTLTFNALNEPTNVSYSDGTHSVAYGYDTQGNLTSRADATGTTNYGYNPDNQVTSAGSFSYGYNSLGQLNSETYPNGTAITYGYDSDANLNSLVSGGQTTSYVYDLNNQLTSETLPGGNGYVATLGYDNAGNLNSLTNVKGTTTLSSYTITQRFADGSPQTMNATNNGSSWTETYSYDTLGRLASVCYQTSCPNGSDPKISWVYDPVGNRQTETRANGVSTTYSYNNADQLQSANKNGTVTNYTYDYDGRETAAGNSSYHWNLANQMTSATVGGTTTNYTYDGAGMRTSSATGANTINYTWDEAAGGLPTLASETNGSGGALRTYLYGASNSPVSMVTPGGTYYYHADASGNVADMTSSTGATQWAYQYEPFGLIRSATNVSGNAPTNPIQFAGQYTDTATGLSDMRARQYDPNTGAFLSTDPLGQNPNSPYNSAYEYGADLPLINGDPTGMSCLGFGSGSCGQDLSAAAGAVYHFVVQPFVQTVQYDWACVSRQTHCAAAALNTGLTALALVGFPEGLVGKDIALAAAEASRGALRDVGTTIGERVTGGLYRLATEQGGSVRLDLGLGGVGRDAASTFTQDASKVLSETGVASDAAKAADSLPIAESVDPAALGDVSRGVTNAAAEDEADLAGIVYRRVDLNGGKTYVGQTKSEERFIARQAEHERANPGALYTYEFLGRAGPGTELDRLEEYWIRELGGPTNKGNPGGLLANARHQMSDPRYQVAGGNPLP
jgi:RHS repeat-associated protein